jgi:hypothetical protein
MKNKLYLIPGVLVICFLIGGAAAILFAQGQLSILNTPSAYPTSPRINLPVVQYPTIPPSAPTYSVPIRSLDSSGVSGTATFQDIAGAVAIMLQVDGLGEEVIAPAELRSGTCADPGPLIYPMVAPDAGESETDLSINLKQFNTQRPMAVILYRSTTDHTAIACGNIP